MGEPEMGTNYYLIEDVCPHCGRGGDRRHIGKSSGGWCFSLHVPDHGEDGPTSLEEWLVKFRDPKNRIEDEYGQAISAEDMEATITKRSWPVLKTQPASFYDENHALPGPKNLLRHKIGFRCLGHGDGTWDLITGNFS